MASVHRAEAQHSDAGDDGQGGDHGGGEGGDGGEGKGATVRAKAAELRKVAKEGIRGGSAATTWLDKMGENWVGEEQ